LAGFIIPTVEEVIANRRDNKSYSELRFPDDLGPHAIIFNFSDYSYDRSANTISTVTTSSICLPIPGNLIDTFSLGVKSYELGPIGDMARTAVGTAMDATSIKDGLQKIMNNQDLGWNAAARVIKATLASADVAAVKGGEIALGTIVNPHVALTFDGIDLKNHKFDWQFAPRSSSESVRLAKIIRTIKQSILPTYGNNEGRTFLQYPKVVDIFFMGSEPGHMYFFKRCMVSGFEANYSPNNVPVFLPGGRPGFVGVSMSLTEMEIHTATDYQGAVTK
jgi:hypothetical protein